MPYRDVLLVCVEGPPWVVSGHVSLRLEADVIGDVLPLE